jgi:membrane-associated phospholipid phosphatase
MTSSFIGHSCSEWFHQYVLSTVMVHRFGAMLLLLCWVSSASAADAGSTLLAPLKRAARDAEEMTVSPVHWDARAWERAAAAAAAVGALYLADRQLYDDVQKNRSSFSDHFARVITPFGGRRALNASVLMLVGGVLSHDATLRDTGADALESELWAGGVVTPLVKRVAGRARPIEDQGSHSFHPFSKHESFPSGHATNAFAFATAVAGHYDGWLVPTVMYTIASGVAASRINDRAHFPSDVLAGALIGRTIARGVLARHARSHRYTLGVLPLFDQHGAGLSFSIRMP